jgi:flagellar biosynthetic protein FliR
MPAWIVLFTLVLARVGMFVAVMPLFGSRNVPRLVKAGLAFGLTVLWLGPAFDGLPAGALNSLEANVTWLTLGIALARELLLGGLLGFAFGLFLLPARVAGEFIAQEMGLTFGAIVDPTGGNPTGPLPQIFEIVAAVLFFGLDGHHALLAVFHSTFALYPVGQALPDLGGLGGPSVAQLVSGMAKAEEWGLMLAMPVAIYLFLMTVILALMTRAAPQLNLYSVGFPLRLAAGLLAVFLLLPHLLAGMTDVLGGLGEVLVGWR